MSNPDMAFTKALSRLFDLAPDITGKLVEKIHLVNVPSGEMLYRQGEPGDGLHILYTGRMQVRISSTTNDEDINLSLIRAGDVVGEISLFTGGSRTATVVATRDSTLGYLSRKDFDELMETCPEVKLEIAYFIINRLTQGQESNWRSSTLVKSIAIIPLNSDLEMVDFSASLCHSLEPFGTARSINVEMLKPLYARRLGRTPKEFEAELEHYLDTAEEHSDFILLCAEPTDSHWTQKCAAFADAVVFVTKASSDIVQAIALIKRISSAWGNSSPVCELLLVHEAHALPPTSTGKWLQIFPFQRHHHLRRDNPEDFQRLARALTGNSVFLILSGGGARGFAHIGVIRALHEAGIPIDMVGGASQGAIIAAGVAMGWDDDRMLEEYKVAYVDNNPGNDFTLPLFSLLKGEKMFRRLRRHFGDVEIENLWIPFFAVSSNLSTGTEKVHRTGPLCKALKASSAIPAILPPVVENSEVLVDGSILNNLPARIARQFMDGHTIVVDVSANDDFNYEAERFPALWEYIRDRLFSPHKAKKVPKLQHIIIRSMMLAGRREAEAAKEQADLYITPSVSKFDMFDWSNLFEICHVGYKQSQAQIAEWAQHQPWLTARINSSSDN